MTVPQPESMVAAVARLDLEPGDVAVLTVPDLTSEMAKAIKQEWAANFPWAKCIVLAHGMELRKLTSEERQELLS